MSGSELGARHVWQNKTHGSFSHGDFYNKHDITQINV